MDSLLLLLSLALRGEPRPAPTRSRPLEEPGGCAASRYILPVREEALSRGFMRALLTHAQRSVTWVIGMLPRLGREGTQGCF